MSTKVDQVHALSEEEYLHFEEVDLAVFRRPATASPLFEVTFPYVEFYDEGRLRQVCDFDDDLLRSERAYRVLNCNLSQ